MSGLFPHATFNGFGPDRLRPDGDEPPTEWVTDTSRKTLRNRVKQLCPRRAGVYGMLDRRGTLIYVGKAKLLRNRLLGYFRKGSRDEKAGRIIGRSRTVIWEPAPSEFHALIRELELIRRWRPKYNVLGIPDNDRFIYLCIGRQPAPYAFAARQPTGREVAIFGPIKGAGMANEAARRVNDLFQLRDCSQRQKMHFADQGELFPMLRAPGCLRHDLGTCTGPCAALTTRGTYSRHVRQARQFLDGNDLSVIDRLQADMLAASEKMQFERAATLRDKLAPLLWLRERLDWLDEARLTHSFIYPVAGNEDLSLWYLIRRGRVVQAILAPCDDATREAATAAIQHVYDRRVAAADVPAVDQVDHVLLVSAWFRKFDAERAALLPPEQALQQCRD
ncbi:MAG: GIY-YIG nuclease family protein [Gemmataceae bacterium]